MQSVAVAGGGEVQQIGPNPALTPPWVARIELAAYILHHFEVFRCSGHARVGHI
jgi:hypothetical protein